MAVHPIILVTTDPRTVNAVTGALASNGRLSPENVLHDLGGLTTRLEGGPVPAVLVDLDVLPARAPGSLEPLIRRFPEARFVLLVADMPAPLLLEAMQSGVRHCLLKKAIPEELVAALGRLCATSGRADQGQVVTILSAGGGCGATTLAINLATELPHEPAAKALLVDLDCSFATVAPYLGLQGQFGAFELLGRNSPIDADLIATTALTYSSRLQVLPTTRTAVLPGGTLPRPARLGELLRACQAAYPYTVIDAPRQSPEVSAELARHSTAILVVLQLTIKDLRVARLLLAALSDQGINPDIVRAVVSRFRRRTLMIEPEQARHALGREDLILLSNDTASVAQAINFGQPLAQAAPHCTLRREMQHLAATVRQPHPVPALAHV